MINPLKKAAIAAAIAAVATGAGVSVMTSAGAASSVARHGSAPHQGASPHGPRDGGQPGPQGPRETPLTGTDLATATSAVQATLPTGATIVRIESSNSGTYPYEAHVVLANGTREIVELNSSFQIITTMTDQGPGPRDGGQPGPQGPRNGPEGFPGH